MKKFLLSLLTLMSMTAHAGYETGGANSVLRIPGGGGRPKFGQVNIASAAAVTGVLATANGGTGGTLPIANGGTGQVTKDAYLNKSIATKTTTYTVTTADDVVLASGSAFTLTLYAASGNTGKILIIKKTDTSTANVITIDANASETIDGALTATLNFQEQIVLLCDGSNWHILSRSPPGRVYYSAYYPQSASNYWTTTNTGAHADFTVVGTIPNPTIIQQNGFTVAKATSNLPGINFTAPRSGVLKLTWIVNILPGQQAAANNASIKMIESTTAADLGFGSAANTTGNTISLSVPVTIVGYLTTTSGTTYNVKIQGTIGSGTLYIGAFGGGSAISVNMEYISN